MNQVALSALPTEVWHLIFSLKLDEMTLLRCRRVCKLFYHLISEGPLSQYLHNNANLSKLNFRCENLENFRTSRVRHWAFPLSENLLEIMTSRLERFFFNVRSREVLPANFRPSGLVWNQDNQTLNLSFSKGSEKITVKEQETVDGINIIKIWQRFNYTYMMDTHVSSRNQADTKSFFRVDRLKKDGTIQEICKINFAQDREGFINDFTMAQDTALLAVGSNIRVYKEKRSIGIINILNDYDNFQFYLGYVPGKMLVMNNDKCSLFDFTIPPPLTKLEIGAFAVSMVALFLLECRFLPILFHDSEEADIKFNRAFTEKFKSGVLETVKFGSSEGLKVQGKGLAQATLLFFILAVNWAVLMSLRKPFNRTVKKLPFLRKL